MKPWFSGTPEKHPSQARATTLVIASRSAIEYLSGFTNHMPVETRFLGGVGKVNTKKRKNSTKHEHL
jgi:hypothetical protein